MPDAIDILSDMLNYSLLDEKALKKREGVIIEEIDMYDDSPEDLCHEMLQQQIWKDHPFRFYNFRYQKVVKNVTRDDILEFMANYYTAENIFISVAGVF